MYGQILSYLSGKWNIVIVNWDIFITIILLISFTVWSILQWNYRERILTYQERITTRDEEISNLKNKLSDESIENLRQVNNNLNRNLENKDKEIIELKEKLNKFIDWKENKAIKIMSNKELAEEAINLVTRIQDCIENSDKSAFYGEYIAKLILAEEYERKYLNWAIGVKREISLRILPKKTEVSEEDYITTYERDKILIICEDLMGLATIVKAEK
jgi:hypothetical protein